MPDRIFVGMTSYTVALHWQVFGFVRLLPDLENITRLRCLEVQKDYQWALNSREPFSINSRKDELAIVDLARLSEMNPAHLKAFYAARNPQAG